jgi:hypothetical protein
MRSTLPLIAILSTVTLLSAQETPFTDADAAKAAEAITAAGGQVDAAALETAAVEAPAAQNLKGLASELLYRSVELESRVRLREATNTLRKTPEISALSNDIAAATTDEEMRLARIAYYTALDKGLRKALPDLTDRIEQNTSSALGRLGFNNVRSHEEVAAEASGL